MDERGLITCPMCGHPVSEAARTCLDCGERLSPGLPGRPNPARYKPLDIALLLIGIPAILIGVPVLALAAFVLYLLFLIGTNYVP